MSKSLKLRIAALVAVVVASLLAMTFMLGGQQDGITLGGYNDEMNREAEELKTLVADAEAEVAQNTQTYDEIYQSKAASVAFIANNDAGFEATDAKMAEYKDLLGVDNVMVVDRAGAIVARAQDTQADFSYARYNQLRTVFETGQPSAAVDLEIPEKDWSMRYYAARIDDDTMVVVEQNPAELDALVESTGSIASVLSDVTVGQYGYVFAVSARDYVVQYHPNDALVGADALDAGIDVSQLEDGFRGWMTLGGEKLYCGVSVIGDTYYLMAVPEADIMASRNITVGVTLFVFFAVMAIIALYAVFIMREEERRGYDEGHFSEVGPLRYNKAIGKKAAVLSFVGLVGIIVVTFYMQTLFALSSQSVTNTARVAAIESTMATTEKHTAALEEQYNERYLSKAQVAAYVLDHNPALADRASLRSLADTLQVKDLFVFDGQGVMTSTSSSYANFTLSEDPADQSYEFRKLLQGVDVVVQQPMADEISGDLAQYIGVVLHDETGTADGFVQMAIRPTRLENLLSSVQIENVLDGVKVGIDGFAFAVNKADGTVAYHPDHALIGKNALDVGLTQNQLKDGYSDYMTINGTQYFVSSAETDQYYLYAAGTEGELMASRVPLTLTTGLTALVCLVVIFFLVAFGRKNAPLPQPAPTDPEARMIDVSMPDGRTVRTESVATRWLNKPFKWAEKTAEQKIATVVQLLGGVTVLAVCVAVVFQDAIFGPDSIFAYILGGQWERGLNIFALTASIMFACVALTAAVVVQKLLNLLSGVFGARGETICRLLGSFVKYVTLIGMLFYCLGLLGVDTMTLLASAGLLSLAISLGAKDLVTDILSGLFIIFEGDFRVGDIIQVGDWRGTVVEIGVRATKVQDGSQNIKVIRNSNVTNVINMTKQSSFAAVDVGIEYSESLERVENILSDELPFIRKRLPAIQDGPFYKGVVALADNSVNIRIVAQCAEADRGQLERDLNREMKLLCDKYDISIPFPQVVINKPTERREVSEAEKRAADLFNEEQKIAARHLGNEDGEDDATDDGRH